MQFHDPFSFDTPSVTVVADCADEAVRPFGAGLTVDVPADKAAEAECARSYFDPERQISLVNIEGVAVPMMRRDSGKATTTTNQHDRNSPDDDSDVGPNH